METWQGRRRPLPPLHLIGALTLKARLILQGVCYRGLDWSQRGFIPSICLLSLSPLTLASWSRAFLRSLREVQAIDLIIRWRDATHSHPGSFDPVLHPV
jgi:hypothetical protein